MTLVSEVYIETRPGEDGGPIRLVGTFTPSVFEGNKLGVYDLDGFGVVAGRWPLPKFIGKLLWELRQRAISRWGEFDPESKNLRNTDRKLLSYESPVRLRHDRPPVVFEIRRLIPLEHENGEYSPEQVSTFKPIVVLTRRDDPTRLPGWKPI